MEFQVTKTREELSSLVKSLSDELAKVRGQRDELHSMLRLIINNEQGKQDFSRWIFLVASAAQLVAKVEANK